MRRASWLLWTMALTGCQHSIGDACTANADCGDRERSCLLTSHVPGGYCTEFCEPGDGTCPDGSTCTAYHGDNVCLRDCTETAECRSGYTCQAYKQQGPYCLSPTDD